MPSRPVEAHTRIKICGITNLEDAQYAAAAGADFLGYVIHPRSARHIDPSQISLIVSRIRERFPGVQHVGVTVNADVEAAKQIVGVAQLDFIQCHGTETPQTIDALMQSGLKVIKALRMGAGSPDLSWHNYSPTFYLCDTYHNTEAGGTGRTFDHSLLPEDLPRNRLFLAGGLTPDNVTGFLAETAPYAVDISSGVEAAPGKKSHTSIDKFIQAVRSSQILM